MKQEFVLPFEKEDLIEYAEFIRNKLEQSVERISFATETRIKAEQAEHEAKAIKARYEKQLEAIKKKLSENKTYREPIVFSEDWNSNELLRFIIMSSNKPLTTAEIFEQYRSYPPLKKFTIMNTSKIATRLSFMADNGVVKKLSVDGKIMFQKPDTDGKAQTSVIFTEVSK